MSSKSNTVTMSPSAIKLKRANKPMMERRRRERINQCLNELKSLVLEAQKKDPSRYNKLEKADILEMTVRHVKSLHVSEQSKYESGFVKCATEVEAFLRGLREFPPDLLARVTSHLNTAIPNLNPPKEMISKPPSFQSVCPITRLTESVPLASLENHKGCFTISKNVGEPLERTVSNFLESTTSNHGFILTTKSNTKVVQWYPPSPPPQEPVPFITQFSGTPNSPNFTNRNFTLQINEDNVQETPLNLVVSSRSQCFPLSPPSSISSSPEPYSDNLGFQVKTFQNPTFSKSEKNKPIVGENRSENFKLFSKVNREPSLVRPAINQLNNPESLHWRPWFASS